MYGAGGIHNWCVIPLHFPSPSSPSLIGLTIFSNTHQTIPFKILTWITSLVLSALLLIVIGGIAFLALWGIGLLIYNVFHAIFHGIIFIINPVIVAAEKLRFVFGEGRGRRRERQDERVRQRERGPGSNIRGRSRNDNVVNVNVQVGQKEGAVKMNRIGRLGHLDEINGLNGMEGRGMRNMGPQRMNGLGGHPPAYRV